MKYLVGVMGVLAGLAGAAQADIYKCVDAQGQVTLRDSPCEGKVKEQTVQRQAPRAPVAGETADAPGKGMAGDNPLTDPAQAQTQAVNTLKARAFITEGVQVAAMVKVQVTEFYMTEGRLPASNAELGLPPAKDYVRNAIIGLTVGPGGVITVQFNEQAGVKNGVIRLSPDISKPHMGMAWNCTTPSFRDIGQWLPLCHYQGK